MEINRKRINEKNISIILLKSLPEHNENVQDNNISMTSTISRPISSIGCLFQR